MWSLLYVTHNFINFDTFCYAFVGCIFCPYDLFLVREERVVWYFWTVGHFFSFQKLLNYKIAKDLVLCFMDLFAHFFRNDQSVIPSPMRPRYLYVVYILLVQKKISLYEPDWKVPDIRTFLWIWNENNCVAGFETVGRTLLAYDAFLSVTHILLYDCCFLFCFWRILLLWAGVVKARKLGRRARRT